MCGLESIYLKSNSTTILLRVLLEEKTERPKWKVINSKDQWKDPKVGVGFESCSWVLQLGVSPALVGFRALSRAEFRESHRKYTLPGDKRHHDPDPHHCCVQ